MPASAEEGQPPQPLEGSAELRLLWEWDRQQDAARESAWHEGRCRIRDAQLAAEQAGRRMAAAEAAQTAGALAQQICAEQRRADALRGELGAVQALLDGSKRVRAELAAELAAQRRESERLAARLAAEAAARQVRQAFCCKPPNARNFLRPRSSSLVNNT